MLDERDMGDWDDDRSFELAAITIMFGLFALIVGGVVFLGLVGWRVLGHFGWV